MHTHLSNPCSSQMMGSASVGLSLSHARSSHNQHRAKLAGSQRNGRPGESGRVRERKPASTQMKHDTNHPASHHQGTSVAGGGRERLDSQPSTPTDWNTRPQAWGAGSSRAAGDGDDVGSGCGRGAVWAVHLLLLVIHLLVHGWPTHLLPYISFPILSLGMWRR